MKQGPRLLVASLVACAPPGQAPSLSSLRDPPSLDAGFRAADVAADARGKIASADATPSPSALMQAPAPASVTSPYRVRLVDERRHDLPTFVREGRTYALGEAGARYSILVSNPTDERAEAVVSVDGLDVLDGEPTSYEKRGYILPPHDEYAMDGFRTSRQTIATFRFSSVDDSYAAQKGMPRDVGIIGVAFFKERKPDPEAIDPHPAPPARPIMRAPARRRAVLYDQDIAPQPAAPAPRPPPAPPAPPAPLAPNPTHRPGLGTAFGEERPSYLGYGSSFTRASDRPATVSSLRYNDRAGLAAVGILVPPP